MKKEHSLSIWFLIGLQLSIYGFLIAGVSIYNLYVPSDQHTVLEEYHPGIYWGALMLIVGLVYLAKFRPRN